MFKYYYGFWNLLINETVENNFEIKFDKNVYLLLVYYLN